MTNKRLDFCHRVYMEIRSVAAAFQSYMDPLFSEVGLKSLEGCLLAELDHCDGQSINELSRSTSITSTNLPPLWHSLEEKGLIERRRDEVDGRSYRLYLTDAGREVLARLNGMIGSDVSIEIDKLHNLQARTIDGFSACRELLAYEEYPHDKKPAKEKIPVQKDITHRKEEAAQ